MGRQRLFAILLCIVFSLVPLFNSLEGPRVQALHGADILQLIASGLLFGVGLGLLLGKRRFPGE